jgi:hypothetical protein
VARRPDNVTYPQGWVKVDKERNEVYGWNDERQEWVGSARDIVRST